MINYKIISEEVATSDDAIYNIGESEIKFLIHQAKKTKRKRYRLCLHNDNNHAVHEMFIVHPKDAYVKPHKHIQKSESLFVLKGEVDYVTFDDYGKINKVFHLNCLAKKGQSFISLRKDIFHTMIVKSQWLVFLETTSGPFKKNETVFSSWSPNEEDTTEVKKYISKLKKDVLSF